MTIRYVDGVNGNNSWDGLAPNYVSGTNGPKLTVNGAEDTPVVAGDHVWVRPNTAYREQLTCDVSGGNPYSTGTVTVTKGSTTVTGSGTTFTGGNVVAGGYFHVRYYDQGTDGITDGSSAFAATAGNFHANLIGLPIQINTKGAYTIEAVTDADNLTLADPNGLGWPTAGTGLTYSIMSGEGHHEIESVDGATTLTLVQPWQGRTHSGLAYLTFVAITYEGDVAGLIWPEGGMVRITGSDNDQTAVRTRCISITTKDYRAFRGFWLNMASTDNVFLAAATNMIFEDCAITEGGVRGVWCEGSTQASVIFKRCLFLTNNSPHVYFYHTVTVDNTAHLFQNCLFIGYGHGVASARVGGITVRNTTFLGCMYTAYVAAALTVGQTMTVNNSIFQGCVQGCNATVVGEIVENYNAFYGNGANRTNTATGANSVTYPALFLSPILHAGASQASGYKFPWWFGELSQWSQIRAIAGTGEPAVDLRGIARPATAAKNSRGAVQYVDSEIESSTVQAGSYGRVLNDAGQRLVRRVPSTAVSTIVTLYVRRQADYAGSVPRMIIKQPGQTDRTVDMVAAVDTWEQLSDAFTPAALPKYFEVWIESRNTEVAGSYKVFFDTMDVS